MRYRLARHCFLAEQLTAFAVSASGIGLISISLRRSSEAMLDTFRLLSNVKCVGVSRNVVHAVGDGIPGVRLGKASRCRRRIVPCPHSSFTPMVACRNG
jgi:hypothetical protein